MQNAECKMQNYRREATPQFCILNFAFCILRHIAFRMFESPWGSKKPDARGCDPWGFGTAVPKGTAYGVVPVQPGTSNMPQAYCI